MDIQIIKSPRKSISIEIKQNLQVIVRAPLYMKNADIQRFLDEKREWLQKHYSDMQAKAKVGICNKLTEDDKKALKKAAKKVIPVRTDELCEIMGVEYKSISLRFQKGRYGSCSSKGNLNFNCILMLCPVEVMDYVIIHELCHLRHMNHSAAFWTEVKKYCPDCKKHKKWLRDNASSTIGRI